MEQNTIQNGCAEPVQATNGSAEAAEPLVTSVENPPPFSVAVGSESLTQFSSNGVGPPKFEDLEPPSYDVAVKLPTYEEAQQEKMASSQQHSMHLPMGSRLHPPRNYNFASSFSHPVGESQFDPNNVELALGTDVYFFASFLIAFLFNWIGFLLLMCACHTVAGRYGALAGFGLSLAKWTLIVKHSTDLASNDNNWLWWLIMAFGVLICVRAVIQYLCIKREWHRLSRAAQERVVFFY